MKNGILKGCLLFFFLSFMLDPTGDFFHLKYISTILIFLVFGFKFFSNLPKICFKKLQLAYLLMFCIIVPIYGTIVAFVHTNLNNFTDTSYIGFSIMLIF